jgi:two-component system sensor histidine kinase/response regulator
MKANHQHEVGCANTARKRDGSSFRILLTDDDLYIRELYSAELIRVGYHVDTATDGADAWKALQNNSYDLLITDYKMPKVTGLELIKKLHLAEIKLPIILISGTMTLVELKKHPELQPDATLAKPFTNAELLEMVKNVLRAANDSIKNAPNRAMLDQPVSKIENSVSQSIEDQSDPRYSILVVDDDNDIRQLNVDVLTGSGYDVEGVKDGAAGWEALQIRDYDLIVTDNQMPKMTGLEMIAKLRAARKTIPVIMATGILPTQEFIRSPWLKPDAMLQRPFSRDGLLATVEKVLNSDDGNDGDQETLLPNYL